MGSHIYETSRSKKVGEVLQSSYGGRQATRGVGDISLWGEVDPSRYHELIMIQV